MARSLLVACVYLLLAGVSLSSGAVAEAQEDAGIVPCDPPLRREPQEFVPNVGAVAVSIDAPLRARYSPGYFGPAGPGGDPAELITVQRCPAGLGGVCNLAACDDAGELVSGLAQVLGDEIVFLPDGGWAVNAAYSGLARGVDGDRAFRFCTGSSRDTDPPTLGPIGDVTSAAVEPRCDAPDGGFRVAVLFDPATDSGPPGSIEYLLFQTRGPGIEGAVLRDRLRNFPTEQITMAFVLPPEEAASSICVRVAAVDGVGNIAFSEPPDDESLNCVDPVQGNFFYPLCSVDARSQLAPARSKDRLPALFGLIGLSLLAVVLYRRR